jgi:MFS family permease
VTPRPTRTARWLNSTVLGIGLASLFSDWSHEMATALMPAFLAGMGAAAAWLGVIEGVSDGISSFSKTASGYYTDQLVRRKPIVLAGYVVTALATASIGLAAAAWQVLAARSASRLGRGIRTPVRKALLAGSVDREAYGRAFGFERMMDTAGAIVGPISAFLLLGFCRHRFPPVFAWTLLPGLLAVACIWLFVREKARVRVSYIPFTDRLRLLPGRYRRFLVAVGVFGLGDFAHTLLILLAAQRLTPILGAGKAASAAVALYVAHNVFYSGFAMVAGWLADRFPKHLVLAAGYSLAAIMSLGIVLLPSGLWTLAAIFAVGGIYVATMESAEDSLCAELVPEDQHGMAFGVMATVSGFGDFISSMVVGLLWTYVGAGVAFGSAAALAAAGAVLILSLGGPARQNLKLET